MLLNKGTQIAVIGSGISGIAAANILKKNGFSPVLFEKHEKLGGVWATAYPDVHLQNIYTQYHLSDFDWSFKPDLHPTGEQIMRYLTEAVNHHKLDIRLKHEVLQMKEQDNGWLGRFENNSGIHEERFEYVILSAGQKSQWKKKQKVSRREQYPSKRITESEGTPFDVFKE